MSVGSFRISSTFTSHKRGLINTFHPHGSPEPPPMCFPLNTLFMSASHGPVLSSLNHRANQKQRICLLH